MRKWIKSSQIAKIKDALEGLILGDMASQVKYHLCKASLEIEQARALVESNERVASSIQAHYGKEGGRK